MAREWPALNPTGEATVYCGPAPTPAALAGSWNFDPLVLLGLAVFGFVLWRRRTQGTLPAACIGWLALFLAFVSPLCALTAGLFTARAFHHLVIMTLAAPALATALPIARRGSVGGWLAALSVIMVAWHVPVIYSWIWQSDLAYWMMQIAMLGAAWAFWSTVLVPTDDAAGLFRGVLGIAGFAGVMGFIGAILTFAPTLLYFEHIYGAAIWGMDPLADQQLAGLAMWVPGFVPLAFMAAMLLRRGWMQGAPA
ncbi:cytochrome c oxidase assembly protein [Falsirhodobacter sp. alg1]|uniref:cytochrome c oxidase assembly protein n=1 Tax=Falsirhodobacter sp. alg1 TaxID=1472418 RepID=UPI0005EFC3D7|nr:cytochrome c oxidase assembly protein [Falsirhodobacter sp. alg1]